MIFLEKQVITVEQWFVDWAETQHYVKERTNADAMLFEQWLIRHKYVMPARHKAHDFRWVNMQIDVKEIAGKWFNVQPSKAEWYTKCYNKKLLTHFLFINTDRDSFKVLKVGDVVNIEPICLLPVKPVIKSIIQSSVNEGGFVELSTLKYLNEDNNETIN